MTLSVEDLKSALSNVRKQREDMWAKFNQAVGAESLLEMLIAKAEQPDPAEPPPTTPSSPKKRRRRTATKR